MQTLEATIKGRLTNSGLNQDEVQQVLDLIKRGAGSLLNWAAACSPELVQATWVTTKSVALDFIGEDHPARPNLK